MKTLLINLLLFNIVAFITTSKLPDQELYQSAEIELPPLNHTARHISPEIINDVSDFIELIPQAFIDLVVAEHYLVDMGFHKALNFLKSPKFKTYMDELQLVPEIVNLLDFLQILVPSFGNESYLNVPYLEIVLLEAIEIQGQRQRRNRRSAVKVELMKTNETASLHTFTNAVNEILAHLPRDKYSNLIKEKCKKSKMFATFYKSLRSTEFRPKVDSVLASKNMKPFLNVLYSNSIDVHALVAITFKVISWGPNI